MGALFAVAIATVLGLFGAAFGYAAQSPGSGLAVLSGVWEVLTPLVATFAGALMATRAGERHDAYLNGLMVWCIMVAYSGFLGLTSETVRTRLPASLGGAFAALAGLAALLALAGALIGSAVGRFFAGRAAVAARELESHAERGYEPLHAEHGLPPPPRPPGAEPPSVRH